MDDRAGERLMRAGTLTWLALRELWMSYRFLGLLAVGLASGIVASLTRPLAADLVRWLAWGLAAAACLGAAVAGWVVADERRRGRMAWLAVRSVPRSATLFAWFGALALPLLVGAAGSGLVAWLANGIAQSDGVDPVAYGLLVTAAAAVLLEALAAGVLAGSLASPLPAAASGLVAGALLVGVGLLGTGEPPLDPTAGIGLLASLPSLARPVSDALVSTGIGLAGVAFLLAGAAAVISRRDL